MNQPFYNTNYGPDTIEKAILCVPHIISACSNGVTLTYGEMANFAKLKWTVDIGSITVSKLLGAISNVCSIHNLPRATSVIVSSTAKVNGFKSGSATGATACGNGFGEADTIQRVKAFMFYWEKEHIDIIIHELELYLKACATSHSTEAYTELCIYRERARIGNPTIDYDVARTAINDGCSVAVAVRRAYNAQRTVPPVLTPVV